MTTEVRKSDQKRRISRVEDTSKRSRRKRCCRETSMKMIVRSPPPVTFPLQRLYMSCLDAFKGVGTVPSPSDDQKLRHILENAVIPLHNHPGMTVFSKLLLGKVHKKAYDLINRDIADTPPSLCHLKLACLKVDNVIATPCNSSVLYPTSGGNIHAFTAITPCMILDVVGPPYSKKDGRDCSYYKEIPYIVSPHEQMATPEEDGKCYRWLEEIEMPKESEIGRIEYLGPQIIEVSP